MEKTHYFYTPTEMDGRSGKGPGTHDHDSAACGYGSFHFKRTKDKTRVDCEACLKKLSITKATETQIETVTRHYLIALLWSMPADDDNENPGDGIHVSDLPTETFATARADCEAFIAKCGPLFWAAMACFANGYGRHPDAGSAEAAFGHDYALTRNSHGVGFWDRASEGLPQQLGDALTALCQGKEADLYIGDNGKAYF